jgi:hypothetical protein
MCVDLPSHNIINIKNHAIITSSALPVAAPCSSGPSPIMYYDEESAFADWLVTCSNLNLPVSKTIANNKARQILERRGAHFTTKSGLPSKKWWYGFTKRFPAVAIRKKQSINRARALLTQSSVDAFFTDLHTLQTRKHINPEVSPLLCFTSHSVCLVSFSHYSFFLFVVIRIFILHLYMHLLKKKLNLKHLHLYITMPMFLLHVIIMLVLFLLHLLKRLLLQIY